MGNQLTGFYMMRAHPEKYFQTDISSRAFTCSSVTGTVVQQSLARFFTSHWHNFLTVTGVILQQTVARMSNSRWQDCSTVADMILQQSVA